MKALQSLSIRAMSGITEVTDIFREAPRGLE